MELGSRLKEAASQLSVMADRVVAVKAKLEDLLFRAQRLSSSAKNNIPNSDAMYGYDLQNFRRSLRTFSEEIAGLPILLGLLERQAVYDEQALQFAQSMMRVASRMAQALQTLHDTALLAHQHIRASDHKVEAWSIAQEIEAMAQKGQGLPLLANKIVIITSTPPP